MVVSVFGFWLAHGRLVFAFVLGLKLALVILASRFVLLVCRFSGGSNDTSGYGVHAVIIFLGAAFGVVFFGVAGLASLAVMSWIGWLLCAAAVLDAFALHRFYGWFYHRNFFDLMSAPRR